MKKLTLLWLSLALAAILLLNGCTSCSSCTNCLNTEEDSSNVSTEELNQTATAESVNTAVEPEATSVPATAPEESSQTSQAGGNPDKEVVKEITITVSEDKYFVDNHEKSFDELVEELKAENGSVLVKLYDENATFNAFDKVKNYLEDNDIEYELS